MYSPSVLKSLPINPPDSMLNAHGSSTPPFSLTACSKRGLPGKFINRNPAESEAYLYSENFAIKFTLSNIVNLFSPGKPKRAL